MVTTAKHADLDELLLLVLVLMRVLVLELRRVLVLVLRRVLVLELELEIELVVVELVGSAVNVSVTVCFRAT